MDGVDADQVVPTDQPRAGRADPLARMPLARSVEVRTFVKFSMVGVVNTAIDMGVFIVLQHFLRVPYLIANVFAFMAAAINSYALNRRWTFRSQAPDWHREMLQYLIVIGIGFLMNEGLLYVLVAHGHLPAIVAKVLVTGVVVIWSFLANRLWTFRRRHGNTSR